MLRNFAAGLGKKQLSMLHPRCVISIITESEADYTGTQVITFFASAPDSFFDISQVDIRLRLMLRQADTGHSTNERFLSWFDIAVAGMDASDL